MTAEQLAKLQRDFLIKTEKQSAILIESELMRVRREFLGYVQRNLTPETRLALDSFLREFIALLDAEMDIASYRFARIVERSQRDVISFAADSLKKYLPRISSSIFEPDKEAIAKLIGRTQTGESLQKFFLKMKPDIAERTKTALVEGFREGDGAAAIAKRITDVSDVGRYNALRISRTETNESYRAANRDFLHSAGIKKYIWLSVLDSRVCLRCWFLHGQKFKSNVKVFSHPNCRCVLVGLLPNQQPVETGTKKFDKLEPGYQKQILGNSRFELYRSDKIKNIGEFVKAEKSKEYGMVYSIKNLSDL